MSPSAHPEDCVGPAHHIRWNIVPCYGSLEISLSWFFFFYHFCKVRQSELYYEFSARFKSRDLNLPERYEFLSYLLQLWQFDALTYNLDRYRNPKRWRGKPTPGPWVSERENASKIPSASGLDWETRRIPQTVQTSSLVYTPVRIHIHLIIFPKWFCKAEET